MDLNAFVGLGGVPIIQALVALVKRMFPKLSGQYLPGVSVAWGIVLNLAIVWPLMGVPLKDTIIVGIVAGLVASGLYQTGKDWVATNKSR